ncbi:MAG: hypothetical protein LAQ30_19885, partial [Acidobacteriia bacterium]|nr:hypothetical protein [Terriglobia bacterium]
MRWKPCPISIAFAAALLAGAASVRAAAFGSVVPIGGHVSDFALDESRGILYIANFTANRIEVMSTADRSIRSSMNVPPQPGAVAVSRDGQYLIVAHYGNWADGDPMRNLITLIDLPSGARQTFVTGEPPLGVAFVPDASGNFSGPRYRALIVTTTSFVLLNPVSGAMQVLTTFADLSPQSLPLSAVTLPSKILKTAVTASGDGYAIWGIGDGGTGSQVVFCYDVRASRVYALPTQSAPPLLPRVSVNTDGTQAMIGYAMFGANIARITGGLVPRFQNGVVLAQYPGAVASPAPYTQAATLSVMDADNLTLRDRLMIPENIVGRASLSADGKNLYAVSDSGIMVLPVGSLNQYARLTVSQEDLFVQANFCDRRVLTRTLTITDPGGGNTDFTVAVDQPGVSVSPTSGVTPATIQVRVDPNAFQAQTGSTSIPLVISSRTAVNAPRGVRLLVSNPDPDQRGTVIPASGRLTDMLTDPQRNRIYLLRQDKNQLLVYDGGSYGLIATLRTAATPNRLAFSIDRKYLLVGHDNAQAIYVFDLDSLQPADPVLLPFGQYARSMAESNAATLAVVREGPGAAGPWIGAAAGAASIDRIDLPARQASSLPTLGIWSNSVSADAALAPAPNGASILLAEPDGNVKLYSASSDTFVAGRKDLPSLKGAIAASSYESYVIGNNVLNKALVPVGTLDSSTGATSGFAFVNQGGFRTTGASSSGPGAIQNLATLETTAAKTARMVEAPLMPGSGMIFTRTVAPLVPGASVAALTTSGFTVLSWNYDAAVAPPAIASVVNAADGTKPVAPGGLISVYGQQMSPVNMATRQMPLPTALGESCVTVNGTPVPLLFVSNQQINAQLPFNVSGAAVLNIRTPGGTSDNYYFTVSSAAPSIFRSGAAGPLTGLATVVRWNNGELVTPANPVHPNDILVVYLTGMGVTTPEVD